MRRQLLVREELRDIAQVHLLGLVEQLLLILPTRAGSLFSCRSLSEDIRVSVPTIIHWMEILERLFVVFKITPYSRQITRSLRKQPKYYFYDWSQVEDEGIRFENLVALHLKKAVQLWTNLGQATLTLHFIRDRNGREADFLVANEGKPWFLVEAKLAETQISESLRFFSRRLGVPAIQLVLREGVLKKEGALSVISAGSWLPNLP